VRHPDCFSEIIGPGLSRCLASAWRSAALIEMMFQVPWTVPLTSTMTQRHSAWAGVPPHVECLSPTATFRFSETARPKSMRPQKISRYLWCTSRFACPGDQRRVNEASFPGRCAASCARSWMRLGCASRDSRRRRGCRTVMRTGFYITRMRARPIFVRITD
jgi:hypothetical protein